MKINFYNPSLSLAKQVVFSLFFMLFISIQAKAQFSNVPVTGFNADVVANGVGAPNISAPDGVDAGNYVFIDGTYQYSSSCTALTTNILPSSNQISSLTTSGLTYQLQSYSGLNSMRLVGTSSGKLFATTPFQAATVYVLVIAGGGAITSGINVTVKFTDSTSQVFSNLSVVDWCSGTSPATAQFTRIQNTATACATTNNCQYLYDMTLALAAGNYTKSVAYLQFDKTVAANYFHAFAVGMRAPCATPTGQPVSLSSTSTTTTAINASFTAPATAPTGYLVVRYPQGTTTITAPASGTAYTQGQALGLGTVVTATTTANFSATGLSGATSYDFYVYSYNSAANCGGPVYLTTTPLTGTIATNSCGTVSGTIAVGPGLPNTIGGGFTSLTNAITAINASGLGSHTTLELQSGYDGTSANETFPITFPVNPCIGPARTLTIRPASGVTGLKIISGAAVTIDFNGAQYIIIDGRPGGSGAKDLAIINTSTSGVAIRFINDACNNTIKYDSLIGVNSASAGGVVFFSTTTGTRGNDSNVVDNCDIRDGATTPATAIYSAGTTTLPAQYNSNNVISNCNIYNFWNATLECNAFKIAAGNTDWVMTGNSMYQTATRTATVAFQQYIWNCNNASANNHIMTNNYIGGSAPLCGGTPWTVTSTVGFRLTGAYLNVGSTVASTFSGNTFANINLTSGGTAYTSIPGVFSGPWLVGGLTNVNNNTFGSTTATNSIVINSSINNNLVVPVGSTGTPTGTISIKNNTFGGITVAGISAAISSNLYCISVTTSTATTTYNIDSNIIGNSLADNILASAASTSTTGQQLAGILTTATSYFNLRGNTVRNFRNNAIGTSVTPVSWVHGIDISGNSVDSIAGNTISNLAINTLYQNNNSGSAAIVGIRAVPATAGNYISGNTLYGFTCTNNGAAVVSINGIVTNSMLTNSPVQKNSMYSFNMLSTSPSASIFGINHQGGSEKYVNNMIRLGLDSTGAAVTTTPLIYGLYKAAGGWNAFFNSVYIGGTNVGTGVANTFAYYSAATGTDSVYNNIFSNERSNSSTGGTHYATGISANTTLSSNYNVLWSNGAGGAVGLSGAASYTSLSAWTSATGIDGSSSFSDPQFLFPAGSNTTGNLHISATAPTTVERGGILIPSVTDDIDGQARNTFTPTDIGADAGNFTGIPMTIDSVMVDQVTLGSPVGATNQAVVIIRVYAKNNFNPLTVSSFKLNTAGTTNVNDISNAKIYATGSNSTFSTATQIGSTITAPNGLFYITGSRVLSGGVNYFWLTYDIKSTATINNFADARVDSLVIGGVNTATTNGGNPAGARKIAGPLSGSYNVGAGQPYLTITAALTELNTLGVSGPVIFNLTDPLYSTAETFPLTLAAYAGSSPTNTVTFRPSASNTGAVISSANVNTTIDFAGAANFIIDGRPGGTGTFTTGANLVINNTQGAAPAIRYLNEAFKNKVLYCDVQSNNSSATSTATGGVINFGTSTGANGNDSNTIAYCDIRNVTGGNPVMAISSVGSALTIANNNDGNIIDNCNIYDFFSPTISSAGIYIGANNGGWLITNNHFYQTAARTVTAGFIQRVLWITPNASGIITSASGFVISNNFIGGSAANGSGMWTLTGVASHQLLIVDLFMGFGTTTMVKNNTITNWNFSTPSASNNMGFQLNRGNIDLGDATGTGGGNTIGSSTANSAIVYTNTATGGGSFLPIRTGDPTVANTYNVNNNIVGGIDMIGNATTIASNIACINLSGGWTVNCNNNLVGSTTVANSINLQSLAATSTNSSAFSGIIANVGAGTTVYNVNNNTVANIAMNYAANVSGTAVKGIRIEPTIAGSYTCNNNNINNLRSNALTIGSGLSSAIVGMDISATVGTYTMSGNTIHTLVLTNSSTTTATQITGLFYSGPTTGVHTISKNKIHTLYLSAVNPNVTITAITVSAGIGNFYNNMIRLGIDSAGNAVTAGVQFRGFTKGIALASNFYHNSVFIEGTGVGASSLNSFAFQRSIAPTALPNDDIRNNIFVNNRSNASSGAKHYAFSAAANTFITLNNNVYSYTGAGGVFGLNLAVDVPFYSSGWLASDVNSAAGNPQFITPLGNVSTVDLHIHPTNPTPVEASGVPIAIVTDDIDGQVRSALSPTDIGADAGNFVLLDLMAPVIGTVSAGNTSSTGNRIIQVSITDATGIPKLSNSPMIYYKKSAAGLFSSSTATFASGTPKNGVWNFNVIAADMGGLSLNDSVYFYIVAQDSSLSANLGSSPGGAIAGSVSSVSSIPPSLYAYKIVNGFSGAYNVGTGNLYTSLTGTGGAFEAINAGALSANVTLNISSDITETGINGLNPWSESGTGNYTLSIVPDAAVVRTLSGVVTAGLIRINGADRVKIDGRFAGSGRYLNFVDTSTAGSVITLINDAHLDTVRNVIIQGNNTTTGDFLFGANAAGGTGNDSNALMYCLIKSINSANATYTTNTNISSANAAAGAENSENTIAFNEVLGAKYGGINMTATSTGNNWYIYNNYFYQDAVQSPSTATQHSNVWVQAGGGHIIRKNSFGGAATDRSGAAYSVITDNLYQVYVNTPSTLTNTIDSNVFGNITITTPSGAYTLAGIYMANGISNINANIIGAAQAAPGDSLFSSYNTYGIYVSGGTSAINANTIGNLSCRTGAAVRTAGIYVTAGTHTVTGNTVRNLASLSTATTFGSDLGGIIIAGGTNNLIEGNTIYNISNVNPATAAYQASGLELTGGTNNTISRNRIYNITSYSGGTGAGAPQVAGMYVSSTGNNLFRHNQVSVGNGLVSGETRVSGILDAASLGNNTYYYNSVFVNGNTTAGANNSYAIQRTSAANLLAWNNIFFNKRTTAGTGFNYATGSASATGITYLTSNYNLFVVNDTARISEFPSSVPYGINAYNNLLYTGTGTSNTNWMAATSAVPAQTFFTDTVTGNLGIVAANAQSWYANGKGIALAGITGDYNSNTTTRSVTIAGGATDIGSVEFTPAVAPALAVASAAPANGTTTTYTYAGRPVAGITWAATGTVPTAMSVQYYSGANAPNLIAGKTQYNGYYAVAATGGAGYKYDITLIADSSQLGTVGSTSATRVARYAGSNWNLVAASSANGGTGTMQTSTGGNLNAFGNFTGTAVSNPLPVTLTSLNATANGNDVIITWSTASETNNKGFVVERSVNGNDFEFVTYVKGSGNSTRVVKYSASDLNAFTHATTLFYRLRTIDNNNAESVSNVVTVSKSTTATDQVHVFPNPFITTVSISLQADNKGFARIEIIDMQGKVMVTEMTQVAEGMNVINMDKASLLAPGVYLISLCIDGKNYQQRLLKSN